MATGKKGTRPALAVPTKDDPKPPARKPVPIGPNETPESRQRLEEEMKSWSPELAELYRKSGREIAEDVFIDPDGWMNTPNVHFSGRTPNELIGTDDEWKVGSLLRRGLLGMR